MSRNNNYIDAPGRLYPVDSEHILAGTDVIYDDALGMTQAQFNGGIERLVDQKIEASSSLATIINNQINEKAPSIVSNAVQQAIEQMPEGLTPAQVTSIINTEVYGSDPKPAGASVVTSENIVDKLEEAVNGSSSTDMSGLVTPVINQELYGNTTKPSGVYAVTSQNFASILSASRDILNITDTDTKYKLTVNGVTKGDTSGKSLGSIVTPESNGIAGQYLKSTGNGAPIWATIPTGEGGGVTVEDVTTIVNQTIYGSNEKPQGVDPVTTEDLTYGKVGYGISKVNSEGGAVAVDATVPVHEITTTANISGITFTEGTVPEDGHSCHIIVKASEDLSVSLANGATMATVDSVQYTAICPASEDVTLDITAGGYIEFDLFRIGENIYVRGI